MVLKTGRVSTSGTPANVSAVGCPRTLRVKKSIRLRFFAEHRRRVISNNISPDFVEWSRLPTCGVLTPQAVPSGCTQCSAPKTEKGQPSCVMTWCRRYFSFLDRTS
jgi:hypothetical protein